MNATSFTYDADYCRAYTSVPDVFHSYHRSVARTDARTHDYRISSALCGLEQIAIDRFDGDHDSLDHDSFAALAAALQCVGQQGVAGALYRVRLVVAPSVAHAQRAIAAPPMTTVPHARTHHGLLALGRVGRRITSDDVRVCALARLVPAPPTEAQQASAAVFVAGGGLAPPPPPPVLSCEWQNLFRESPSSTAAPVAVGSVPFYFFPKQEETHGGPPFRLYRGAAITYPSYSPFFQEDSDLIAPTPEAQGCVWGVVVNPDCADPDDDDGITRSEYNDPDLEWPAQMCVTSALCRPTAAAVAAVTVDAAAFEPPRFPFFL